MPAKDVEQYIEECLESIVHQTYPNWELIVVDDNSSDKTWSLVVEYSNKDRRIKALHADGSGIVDALRQSYKASRGNFISRMDADDIMAPRKLEVLRKNLENHGEGSVAVGKVAYFSDDDLGEGYVKYATWLNELTKEGDNFKDVYKECVIPSPCWMMYKTDFEQSGAFRSDVYPEDYYLCFRLYEEGMEVIPSNAVLHFWRDYPERTSRTDEHYSDNTFLDLKIDYFLKLDADDNRPLVVWGAGTKGKSIAKALGTSEIDFQWVSNNPNKIDKIIYGTRLEHESKINLDENPQVIVAVANPKEKKEIRSFLRQQNRQPTVDNFYFC